MNVSTVKKQRRKKNNNVSLKGICKKYLKKSSTSNEKTVKKTYTKIQSSDKKKQLDAKNKFDIRNKKESDVLTQYPKNNTSISEEFQKVQVSVNNKRKSKKQKQHEHTLDYSNKDTSKIDNAKKGKKMLQIPAQNVNLEHKRTKIEKHKKINKKKMKQVSIDETKKQQLNSDQILKINKHKISVTRLEQMLVNKSGFQLKPKAIQLTLRDRMMAQLRASRFRFINEILYNNESSQSKHYFKTDPDAFMAYHTGYNQQLEQWSVNPLDVIISSIKKLPTDNVVADFGCGEARLAASVPHIVHSFDFIALNDRVKACDMAHTSLLMNSVNVVVFCLSLMGSNLNDYIIEANRVLKNNGILKIAEIESRFNDVMEFIRLLRSYGFKNIWKDFSHNLFYFMDFKKEEDITTKRKNLPLITLKSCLYKKR